jgi:hypothetical protein
MTKPDSLCWLTFLNARATAIDWLQAEFKYGDAEIAAYLSMDPVQVRLIRERDRRLDVQSPAEPEGELATKLRELAESQTELDPEARRVLYSRMRELYVK